MIPWLAERWFEIVQTLGIAGSLYYAGQAFLLDRNMRRTELLLSLTEAHRSIWEKMIGNTELERVLDAAADTTANPPTEAETRFVKLVLLHLSAVHHAILNRSYQSSPEVDEDVRQFLALPIPRSVLGTFLPYQAKEFREYIASLLD